MDIPLIQLLELELMTPNPAGYATEFRWRMRVEVLDELQEAVSVGFVWVGSAESSEYDQMLDEFDVGPFPVGSNEFYLDCSPPNPHQVPPEDLLGVTVLLITFAYKGEQFLKVGYYVQVAYFDDELNANATPQNVHYDALGRNLLMTRPAITPSAIEWDGVAADEE